MTFWGVNVFAAGMVFARVGTLLMLMPGFGEAMVPPRVRLALALAISVLLAPIIGPKLPPAPAGMGEALSMIISEIAIGLLIGGVARILMTALATAGQIVGLETGLAFAQTADPTAGQAGQIVSVFLGLFGVTMIFATGLDHVFIAAIVGSYDAFTPFRFPDLGDSVAFAIKGVSDSFRIGAQMAAPLMMAGLIFRIGLGILSRLIPQIQVFFLAMPINVLGGFVIFSLALSSGILVWLDALQRFASALT
jgi:flagellar biosynthetic protein FliR